MSTLDLLRIEQGGDYVNVHEHRLPYTSKRLLGSGHTGWVDEVEDHLTGKVYARKKIPIHRHTRENRARVFKNEISTIRGFGNHHHIIEIFATYVTAKDFGLILQPVASDGDLHNFLDLFWERVDDTMTKNQLDERLETMRYVLQRAFGCLAAGLAFIHESRVRHKDVKPRNILVHRGTVIYTDFGYSFDFTGFSRSTTDGKPDAFTKRYSSPELSAETARNRKSDIWALGCVFIEILSALTVNRSLEPSDTTDFPTMMDQLHEQIASIEVDHLPTSILKIVVQMTMRDPTQRLCAVHTADAILKAQGFSCLDYATRPMKAWRKRVETDGCLSIIDEILDGCE
ncbi:kinase-like protein [Ophiobolus disseminans]|uniref:Kinase-like protein n=1 Tax=Ophiobolus disseminans TaxID=1469910 RepID=A0A6A6ZS79_9PLEO|nr:kinase-like protein [Ophiobolus disseminans]